MLALDFNALHGWLQTANREFKIKLLIVECSSPKLRFSMQIEITFHNRMRRDDLGVSRTGDKENGVDSMNAYLRNHSCASALWFEIIVPLGYDAWFTEAESDRLQWAKESMSQEIPSHHVRAPTTHHQTRGEREIWEPRTQFCVTF